MLTSHALYGKKHYRFMYVQIQVYVTLYASHKYVRLANVLFTLNREDCLRIHNNVCTMSRREKHLNFRILKLFIAVSIAHT